MLSRHRPNPSDVVRRRLDPDPNCPVCGDAGLVICDHRHRDIQTLEGHFHLVCVLSHCTDPRCPTHGHTLGPTSELTLAPPRLGVGWDVFCRIGQRRLAGDWRVAQIREELHDGYRVELSADSVERHIARYKAIVAARERDPAVLARAYAGRSGVVLSIDGLQPEKGHETLYVVREVTLKRVWFAVPLLSSAAPEVARLLVQARDWAARLGLPVLAWVSDKQDAFLTGIAEAFPGVPHRYCANHFLRDAARPALELDSHAKVAMRRKVRGLRDIERAIIDDLCADPPAAPTTAPSVPAMPEPSSARGVVLDCCAAVRGILNDDQGGPLHPPGVRMADALVQVRQSLQRSIGLHRPGAEHRLLERLDGCIARGLHAVQSDLALVRGHAQTLAAIDACLDPGAGTGHERKARFDTLAAELKCDADPVRLHMGRVMASFAPGLFAGADILDLPVDNLDLERAFRRPKHHRRRIHGRAHAGSGLVQEGPTLLPALDAHQRHPAAFCAEDLLPWHKARPPRCQREATRRRSVMRRARSTKKRPFLLADLEQRYRQAA